MGECDITNLENDLRGIVAEIVEMEPDEVKLEADFVEDFEMDSMQALEIMAAIEKKYKIQIPEDYLDDPGTGRGRRKRQCQLYFESNGLGWIYDHSGLCCHRDGVA